MYAAHAYEQRLAGVEPEPIELKNPDSPEVIDELLEHLAENRYCCSQICRYGRQRYTLQSRWRT